MLFNDCGCGCGGGCAGAHRTAHDAESVRAAGILIVTGSGRVLLVRRAGEDHHGEWCIPGGHAESSETARQAALRETREEVGWRAPDAWPLMNRSAEGVEFSTFWARATCEFIPRLNDEHDAWRWVLPSAPPKNLHPGVVLALAMAASLR